VAYVATPGDDGVAAGVASHPSMAGHALSPHPSGGCCSATGELFLTATVYYQQVGITLYQFDVTGHWCWGGGIPNVRWGWDYECPNLDNPLMWWDVTQRWRLRDGSRYTYVDKGPVAGLKWYYYNWLNRGAWAGFKANKCERYLYGGVTDYAWVHMYLHEDGSWYWSGDIFGGCNDS
jgi:hypothetical protein